MKVFGAYFHLMPLLYVYLPLPSSRQLTENKWRKSRFPKWEDFLQKREGREGRKILLATCYTSNRKIMYNVGFPIFVTI